MIKTSLLYLCKIVKLHFHDKSREVCIKAGSPPAFKSQVTKKRTEKSLFYHTGNIVSSDTSCFRDANYANDASCASATRIPMWNSSHILTRNRACKQLHKICKHAQASEYSFLLSSNSSKGQFLRALLR